MTTVDSHQHFWQLRRFDYEWIQPDNSALHQDRLPASVRSQMEETGIARSVLVHAANTPEEIPWLLNLSAAYPFIAGVVGWLDLAAPGASQALAGFARHPRFKGVRLHLPVPPGLHSALDVGLRALAKHGLSCDLLLNTAALPQALDLVRAHPGVTFVLDHLAGAHFTPGGVTAYAQALKPLSAQTNVAIKLSGYLTANGTMSDGAAFMPPADVAQVLQPYVDVAVEAFGPQRLLFGSDWPVCTQAGCYADAVATLGATLASLSAAERSEIWGGSAIRIYRLED